MYSDLTMVARFVVAGFDFDRFIVGTRSPLLSYLNSASETLMGIQALVVVGLISIAYRRMRFPPPFYFLIQLEAEIPRAYQAYGVCQFTDCFFPNSELP
jgi:hypothetical protein